MGYTIDLLSSRLAVLAVRLGLCRTHRRMSPWMTGATRRPQSTMAPSSRPAEQEEQEQEEQEQEQQDEQQEEEQQRSSSR